MTYELIQAALTHLITFTAIAGFGGIAIHAIWSAHCNWMATYCPPIDNFNSKSKYLQVEIIEPGLNREPGEFEDIWEAPITSSPARYWVRSTQQQPPTLYLLPPAKEEIKPAKETRKTPAKSKTPAASKRKKAA